MLLAQREPLGLPVLKRQGQQVRVLAPVLSQEPDRVPDGLPAAGNGSVPVRIEGKAYQHDNDAPLAREGIVTAGYFETFEAKLTSGREAPRIVKPDGRSRRYCQSHFPSAWFTA